jgi:hypothetical protein
MTARKRIFANILLLAAAGALGWQIFRPRIPDPIFEGKHLSYWVGRSAGTESFTAQAAVRDAGTNAIPMLLRLMRAHDSAFKVRLIDLTGKLEESDKQLRFLSLHLVSSDDHSRAVQGFEALGPAAKSAVPELLRIYNADQSPDSRIYILEALAGIGPAATETKETLPLLLSEATNTNSTMRPFALDALVQMRVEPNFIVPWLIESLDNPDLTGSAVVALRNLGPQAKSAVPRLIELRPDVRLHSSSSMLRLLDDAIRKIDPIAAENAGIEVTNTGRAAQ